VNISDTCAKQTNNPVSLLNYNLTDTLYFRTSKIYPTKKNRIKGRQNNKCKNTAKVTFYRHLSIFGCIFGRLPVSNNEYLVKEGLMLFFITIDAACRDIEVNCTHPINIFLEFGPPTRLGWRDRLKYFRNMNPQMKSFNEILQWNDDRARTVNLAPPRGWVGGQELLCFDYG